MSPSSMLHQNLNTIQIVVSHVKSCKIGNFQNISKWTKVVLLLLATWKWWVLAP